MAGSNKPDSWFQQKKRASSSKREKRRRHPHRLLLAVAAKWDAGSSKQRAGSSIFAGRLQHLSSPWTSPVVAGIVTGSSILAGWSHHLQHAVAARGMHQMPTCVSSTPKTPAGVVVALAVGARCGSACCSIAGRRLQQPWMSFPTVAARPGSRSSTPVPLPSGRCDLQPPEQRIWLRWRSAEE